MKPFRICTIHLDEDHEVSGITIVLDVPYLAALNKILGLSVNSRDMVVRLDVTQLLTLFREAGSWNSENAKIPGAYDALTLVVYGLMED